jgi:hypothetical protein
MKLIKFTGRYRIYFPGDVASFAPEQADAIVASGAAVYEDAPAEAIRARPEDETAVMPPDEQSAPRRRRP